MWKLEIEPTWSKKVSKSSRLFYIWPTWPSLPINPILSSSRITYSPPTAVFGKGYGRKRINFIVLRKYNLFQLVIKENIAFCINKILSCLSSLITCSWFILATLAFDNCHKWQVNPIFSNRLLIIDIRWHFLAINGKIFSITRFFCFFQWKVKDFPSFLVKYRWYSSSFILPRT